MLAPCGSELCSQCFSIHAVFIFRIKVEAAFSSKTSTTQPTTHGAHKQKQDQHQYCVTVKD
jgi:hypothetical protein